MSVAEQHDDVVEGFPLSPVQAHHWSARSATGAANLVIVVRMAGEPLERVRSTFLGVAAAAPIFATRFETVTGIAQPIQVLDGTDPKVEIAVHDAAGSALDNLVERARLRDLGTGDRASLSIDLVTEGQAVVTAILAAPPHVADATSLVGLAVRAGGRPVGAPSPSDDDLLFQHYSEWANETALQAEGEAARTYWSQSGFGAGETALDVDTGPGAGTAGCEAVRLLDADLLRSLDALGGAEAATLLAWAVIAGQFSGPGGAGRVLVGRLASGRTFDEFAAMSGPFAVRAPIGIERLADTTIAAAVADLAARLSDHEAKAVHLPPEERGHATIGFAWLGPAAGTAAPGSIRIVDPDAPALDLTAHAVDGGVELAIGWRGEGADDGFAARLADALLAALRHFAGSPEAPLTGVPLIGASEFERHVAAQPRTQAPGFLAPTLPEAFRRSAAARPDAPAVVAADATLTFAELDRESEALAVHLLDDGLRPEEPVAVFADRSAAAIVAVLGISKAGGVFVPINPDLPAERIRQMVSTTTGLGRVVAEPRHAGAAASLGIGTVLAVELGAAPGGRRAEVAVEPGQAAYVIFTSGSTGTPKGVVVEHRSCINLAEALARVVYDDAQAGLRLSVNAPLSFDSSIKQVVQLLLGHCLYPVPAEVRGDPERLVAFVRDHRLDVLDATPSLLRPVLAAGLAAETAYRPGRILVGGEKIDAELWCRLGSLAGTRVFNVYGPTEATVNATAAEIARSGEVPTIGGPLPNVCTYVVDPAGRPMAAGAVGELWIGGAGVARGYVGGDPGGRFRPDPFRIGSGRVYATGDQVRCWEDGRFAFVGRIDDQVKISGYRIELGDIEHALARHPDVAEAVVTAVADDGGTPELAGYVTLHEGVADGLEIEIPTGHRIASINANETRYLYKEIFEDRVYLREGIRLPADAVVFDVGANIGMFSLFVATHAPAARIFAFEPLAPIRKRLLCNVRRHTPEVQVFDIGLSDEEREATFTFYPGYSMMSGQAAYADAASEADVIRRYLSNDSRQGGAESTLLLGSFDEVLAGRLEGEAHVCRLRRLADVIRETGVDRIDLLKIDVQRAEMDVLRGLDDDSWLKIRQVVMEVHDQEGGATRGRVRELETLLASRGFEVRIHQDTLLEGTDRYNCWAFRPDSDPASVPVSVPAPAPAVVEPLEPANPEGLLAFLRRRLPAYMVPKTVTVLDAMPLTPQGKVDRKRLPDPRIEPAGRLAAEPRTETERVLLDIWRRTLKRPGIGIDDNFFQAGGDSIRSIQMQAQARDAGLSFTLRDLFRFQTVRELAAAISVPAAPDPQAAPVPAGRPPFALVDAADRQRLPAGLADAYPMTAMQVAMVTATETAGDGRVFHNVTVHTVRARFDEARLRRALGDVVTRHPVLRTSFDLFGYGEPLQLVHMAAEPVLQVHDLTGVEEGMRSAHITELVLAEHRSAFDWSVAPLVRFAAFITGDDAFDLLVSEHHAILDGWSLHRLIEEIADAYAHGPADGAAAPEPGLQAMSMTVAAEHDARNSAESLMFWTDLLAGSTPTRLSGAGQSDPHRDVRQMSLGVRKGVLARLEALSRERSLPVKSLLFGSYVSALGRLVPAERLVVGLVTGCRPEIPHADRALGLFLNVLPLPFVTRGCDVFDLADQAFELERASWPHRLVPVGEIRRRVGPAAVVDTFFNYIQFHTDAAVEGIRGEERRFVAVDVDVPLAVDFEIAGDDLAVGFQYDARRFDAGTVDRIARAFDAALDDLLDAPSGEVSGTSEPHGSDSLLGLVTETVAGILGRRPEPDQDLASLGGHSLAMVRIVAALSRRTGRRLGTAVLRDGTTVSALVRAVREADTVRGPAPAAGDRSRDRWFVRPLPRRTPRLRLVALPPAGGSASLFESWADRLPADVELMACQYPGRYDRADEAPVTSFTDMVDGIVEALLPSVDRPFALAGASLGGLLAFEVARALRRRAGVEPAHLFPICARAPQRREPYPRFHAMTDSELIDALRRFEGIPDQVLDNQEMLGVLLPLVRSDSRVSASYSYYFDEPFLCPITAVFGSRDVGVSESQVADWRSQTTGRFRLVGMNGGHSLIATEGPALADLIGSALAE
jgi:amino acid adenylation domain-containing protein/FkbM family methyltransferase